jgi:hypothetical protein
MVIGERWLDFKENNLLPLYVWISRYRKSDESDAVRKNLRNNLQKIVCLRRSKDFMFSAEITRALICFSEPWSWVVS